MGFRAAQGRLSPAFCFVQTAAFIRKRKRKRKGWRKRKQKRNISSGTARESRMPRDERGTEVVQGEGSSRDASVQNDLF